jgi:hypothetical protein
LIEAKANSCQLPAQPLFGKKPLDNPVRSPAPNSQ